MSELIDIRLVTTDDMELKNLSFDIDKSTTMEEIYKFVDKYCKEKRTDLIEIILPGMRRKLRIKNPKIKVSELYMDLFGDDIINTNDEIHIIYEEKLPDLIRIRI